MGRLLYSIEFWFDRFWFLRLFESFEVLYVIPTFLTDSKQSILNKRDATDIALDFIADFHIRRAWIRLLEVVLQKAEMADHVRGYRDSSPRKYNRVLILQSNL